MRIYIHVIRRTDGTGGQSPSDVNTALSFLEMDFNPHGIYFVWDGCVDYIDDDAKFSIMHPSISYINAHTDGIDIYLYDDAATGQGGTSGVGLSPYFRLGGLDVVPPIVPRVKSHLMSHEMGHVLALFHTFEHCGTINAERVARTGPLANCLTAGDMICDTEADPTAYAFTDGTTCVWSQQSNCGNLPDPLSSYNPDTRNMMASTHPLNCTDHFSPGQVQKMKDAILTLPHLQACLVNPDDLAVHVYQNTVYDSDMTMLGDLIIHSGAELIIEAKIGMPQNRRILVERNARLVIDNGGIVTRACNALDWAGIQVLGNDQKVQPDYNASLTDAAQAGIVWIGHGTIEWARIGVTAGGGYGPEYWGGLIWTNQAIFRNNRKDVEFMRYKFAPNKSRFTDTNFLPGMPTVPYSSCEGITIWETDGIEFDKCSIYSKGMQGIRTYDAGIKVHNGCNLESNQIGISSYATYPMSYKSVIGTAAVENNFYGNFYDIYASTATGLYSVLNPAGKFSMDVVNNNFEGSRYGVIFDGPSTFRIGGNKFVDVGISAWTANTGYNNVINQNLVGCNRIDALRALGILAIGDNKQMQFLANDFIDGWTPAQDFVLINSFFPGNSGTIRELQGNVDAPADNCFSEPGAQVDILTSGTVDFFRYYYESAESPVDCDPEPLTSGNYAKSPAPGFFTVDCDQFGGLPAGLENPTLEDLTGKRQKLALLAPDIQANPSAKTAYYRLLSEKEAILIHLLGAALTNKDYIAAENLLAGEQSKAAQWAIFGLRMSRQDYAGAAQLLDQLPLESVTDTQFRHIQVINLQRLQNPGGFELSAGQEAYLNQVADSYSPIRGYARGILGLLKDRVYFPDEYEIAEERTLPVEPISTEALKVYPVPATNRLTVVWPELPEGAEGRIHVLDMLGRPQLSEPLLAKEATRTISVSHLPTGVYFLMISDKGKVVHRIKFAVQH